MAIRCEKPTGKNASNKLKYCSLKTRIKIVALRAPGRWSKIAEWMVKLYRNDWSKLSESARKLGSCNDLAIPRPIRFKLSETREALLTAG